MFKKILIANRGEIACRVIATARRMGIATVAVHSSADRGSLAVKMADEAVEIGPAPAAESYLLVDRLLDAIRRTGADAVHPGYGFVSENAGFAEALAAEGVTFIGPPVGAIAAMGDKIESKKLAAKAGVSTVPGHMGIIANADEAAHIAGEIGFPVMIKASAGGGGKGMRIARSAADVADGFRSAQNEARSSFADDRIFVEKFIEQPRHIEIQILADAHGSIVYLGERECSIQRRHQKVIEEAPSPFLDAATRKAMGEQACALARAVDYRSAGTVEFIVDRDRMFYFLEMNTRLQVEHPVTEMITGLDLVEQMIRVAAGEELAFSQDDVRLDGWAIEARVYAEDPSRNFLPSIGRLVRYRAPVATDNVRIDTGVEEGSEISMYYDPMIAKLVTHGADRAQAIARMQAALDGYYVRGVNHNMAFLASILAHPRFAEGRLSTDFIADEYPDGYVPETPVGRVLDRFVAIASVADARIRARDVQIGESGEFAAAARSHDRVVLFEDRRYPVTVTPTDDRRASVAFDGREIDVDTAWQPGMPLFAGTIDGQTLDAQIDRLGVDFKLTHAGIEARFRVMTTRTAALVALMPEKEPPDLSRFLLSPMPGLLVSVAVSEGAQVQAGEELAVVEAMKMENILRAASDGIVRMVHAVPGDSLAVDQVIIEFE